MIHRMSVYLELWTVNVGMSERDELLGIQPQYMALSALRARLTASVPPSASPMHCSTSRR